MGRGIDFRQGIGMKNALKIRKFRKRASYLIVVLIKTRKSVSLKCSINFASEKQNQFVKTDYDR
jgi:hypothetical protein